MMRTPPGDGGVLRKDDSDDFADHAIAQEDTPPFRQVSNIDVAFPLPPAPWEPIGAIATRVVLRILPDSSK